MGSGDVAKFVASQVNAGNAGTQEKRRRPSAHCPGVRIPSTMTGYQVTVFTARTVIAQLRVLLEKELEAEVIKRGAAGFTEADMAAFLDKREPQRLVLDCFAEMLAMLPPLTVLARPEEE